MSKVVVRRAQLLSKPHVIAALEAKRQSFEHFERSAGREMDAYGRRLDWLCQQSRQELEEALQATGIQKPGARPTVEREPGRSVVLPFSEAFAHHQQARAWARATLQGVPTLAVDGSQITPSRDFSVPVGAVQVGWFENQHDHEGNYRKEIRFEVLGPDELTGDAAQSGGFPDRNVNLQRFQLECATLRDYMRQSAGKEPMPVCFFDGSLIISFAAQMGPPLQGAYLRAVRELLATSEQTRIPLVGYVDTSRARDLVSVLQILAGDGQAPGISDGALLRGRMGWGDRTEVFYCARDDGLFERADPASDYYARVLFTYVKTTATNAPARLDLPAWLLEAGLLDTVIDVVRAECVVGTGYPYGVETADALAVITARDRERFYRTLQEFTSHIGLDLRYSRKAYSKRGRRT